MKFKNINPLLCLVPGICLWGLGWALNENWIALTGAFLCGAASCLWWVKRSFHQVEKSVEEDIKSIQSKFDSLFVGSLDVILVIDTATGKILTANPAAKNILGHDPAQLSGKHFSTLFPKEESEDSEDSLGYLFGESVGPQDFLKKDGTICPMELVVSMVQWEGIPSLLAMLRDVTERKEAETRLLESERRLKVTIESIQEGIVALDSQYCPYLFNASAKKYLNLLSGEFAPDQPLIRLGSTLVEDILASSNSDQAFLEIEVQEPDYRIFEVTSHELENDQSKKGWVLTLKEVTLQRAMQQKSEAQGKLAALGQLTAGIAHDFRNALAIIIGAAQVRLEDTDMDEKPRKTLEEILDQSNRAGRLIRQMLDFGRKTSSQKIVLDFREEMEKILNLLQSAMPGNIQILWEVTHNRTYHFQGNADQIHQIVTNLAINAMDAMPDGGQLKFKLTRIKLSPDETLPFPEMKSRDWIRLNTTDTGTGIPPKILKRIFEPFYTTKEVGKGTGLGLSQVYGLIKEHRGFIDVASHVGHGTTFTIYLPVEEHPDETSEKHNEHGQNNETTFQEPAKLLNKGPFRVLVVEDEEHILNLMKMYLTKMGHEVVTAQDGKEALDVLDEQGTARTDRGSSEKGIHLIITDATMPEMTGLELASYLMEEKYPINIVVTSGEAEEHWIPNIVGWLAKPVNPVELETVVNGALRECWLDLSEKSEK